MAFENNSDTDLMDMLYTDFMMLADGSWEPEAHSIQSSIDVLEELADRQHHQCVDTRD